MDIGTQNKELIQEINKLSRAFSIVVIKLNLINPDDSEIIVPAIRKESLNAETMISYLNKSNNICGQWISCLKISDKR